MRDWLVSACCVVVGVEWGAVVASVSFHFDDSRSFAMCLCTSAVVTEAGIHTSAGRSPASRFRWRSLALRFVAVASFGLAVIYLLPSMHLTLQAHSSDLIFPQKAHVFSLSTHLLRASAPDEKADFLIEQATLLSLSFLARRPLLFGLQSKAYGLLEFGIQAQGVHDPD